MYENGIRCSCDVIATIYNQCGPCACQSLGTSASTSTGVAGIQPVHNGVLSYVVVVERWFDIGKATVNHLCLTLLEGHTSRLHAHMAGLMSDGSPRM